MAMSLIAIADVVAVILGLVALGIGMLRMRVMGGMCGFVFKLFGAGIMFNFLGLLVLVLSTSFNVLSGNYATLYHLFFVLSMVFFVAAAYKAKDIVPH